MTWTDERHQAAKGRCERTVDGPWEHTTLRGKPGKMIYYHRATERGTTRYRCVQIHTAERQIETAEFIAAARTDLPDALAEIERLRAENAELRQEIARFDPFRLEA